MGAEAGCWKDFTRRLVSLCFQCVLQGIWSTDYAFFAKLRNGNFRAWGDGTYGALITRTIENDLKKGLEATERSSAPAFFSSFPFFFKKRPLWRLFGVPVELSWRSFVMGASQHGVTKIVVQTFLRFKTIWNCWESRRGWESPVVQFCDVLFLKQNSLSLFFSSFMIT